jgi:hypothetical protein
MGKAVSHTTISLDGFIAGPQDGVAGTSNQMKASSGRYWPRMSTGVGVDLVLLGTTGTL